VARTGRNDEVLEALDALLDVLRDSVERSQQAMKQGRAIRRLRHHGKAYREILGRSERARMLEITREGLDRLLETSSRLRRAEARALYDEGMTMEEIATLFGVTRQRVSVLLREGGQQEEESP
jgi:DNA-binding transcriptional regulator LsrR (DeoR family)